jgi:Domain of unknown function (DUF4136)
MRTSIRAWPLVIVLAVAAADAAMAAKLKIKANRDPDFDFRPVKTWAWSESGPGAVKMLRTQGDDPEPVRQRFEPTIVEAISKELVQRGLTPAQTAPPDVTVTYYLLVTLGTSAQHMGQFLPAVAEWGLPPFAAATTAYRVLEQGSIVIDATSPALKQVVWRGVAEAEIDKQRTDEQRDTRIREAVRELIERFPRK